MDISAVNSAMPTQTASVMNEPSTEEVKSFEQLLGADPASFPENDIVKGLQEQQQIFDARVTQANDVMSGTLTPQQLVQSQHHLMNAMVGVDLAAKIAGSASQSVNKLVTMQ